MARSIRKDYSMKSLLTRIPGAATCAIVFLLALPLASLANDHDKHKHHHDHGSAQNRCNNHGAAQT